MALRENKMQLKMTDGFRDVLAMLLTSEGLLAEQIDKALAALREGNSPETFWNTDNRIMWALRRSLYRLVPGDITISEPTAINDGEASYIVRKLIRRVEGKVTTLGFINVENNQGVLLLHLCYGAKRMHSTLLRMLQYAGDLAEKLKNLDELEDHKELWDVEDNDEVLNALDALADVDNAPWPEATQEDLPYG